MKVLRRVLVGMVVVVVGLLLGVIFLGGQMIKTGVNRIGPQVTGVPVTLEGVRFRPLRGFVRLDGLIVGNPEGFDTENLFNMETLEVELDVFSLLTDTIRIRRILIVSPQITYEVGLRGTNLGALIDGMASEEEVAETSSEPGKSVVIEELKIIAARARISTPGMGRSAVPIQLATITLHELGGEGQSTAQIVGQVLKAILGAVGNAALGVGGLVGDGVKAAASGLEQLGGAAVEGAGGVVDAAGDGVRAIGSGMGRMLGLGQAEAEEASSEE